MASRSCPQPPLTHLTRLAQSATDTTTVSFARAIGTLGAGITTGLMLSIPLWQMPATAKVETLAPRDRLVSRAQVRSHRDSRQLTTSVSAPVVSPLRSRKGDDPDHSPHLEPLLRPRGLSVGPVVPSGQPHSAKLSCDPLPLGNSSLLKHSIHVRCHHSPRYEDEADRGCHRQRWAGVVLGRLRGIWSWLTKQASNRSASRK